MSIDYDAVYIAVIKTTDMEYMEIFEDEDVQSYIVFQIERLKNKDEIKKKVLSLVKKISRNFHFAFEHAATRNMGLALFSINDDMKKQQSLMSSAASEGNHEEMANLSKSIAQLEKRYSDTIKRINELVTHLDRSSTAMTLAEREREYYEYKMGKKKRDQIKDLSEERELMSEKIVENKRLGLPPKEGLQDSLSSGRHKDADLDEFGNLSDAGRKTFIEKVQKYKKKHR